VTARIVLILLAGAVVALNVLLAERDPFAWIVLGLADAFLAVLIVAGWRRQDQNRRDREALEKARRERTWRE
jgi:hypothetical protein